jgi:hypothetical protein
MHPGDAADRCLTNGADQGRLMRLMRKETTVHERSATAGLNLLLM